MPIRTTTIHRWKRRWKTFDRLIKAGKVRFIGASNFTAWRLDVVCWTSITQGLSEYCCLQQKHTYLRPKPGANFGINLTINDDLVDYCLNRKITLLAYTALLSPYNMRPRP